MNDVLYDFPNFFMNNVTDFLLWHLSGIIVNLINPNILENKSCTLASKAFIHLA